MRPDQAIFHTIPSPLWRRYAVLWILFPAVIAALTRWLQPAWDGAARWGLLALAAAAIELVVLYRHLPENHRPGEEAVLPAFGPGNSLTLGRGLLLALLTGFLAAPRPTGWLAWLPVFFYTAAALIDILDGLAARRANHATRLGERLDLEYDSFGVGLLVLLAIHFGQVGWWYLIVALVRYWFVLGLWWRRRRGRPVYELSDSRYRRPVAAYNMGFLTVAIWPILTREAVTIGAAIFAAPLLLIFWRDWLVVSGRLDPANPTYLAWKERITRAAVDWLPVMLRLVVAVAMVTTAVLPPAGNPAWQSLFAGWGWQEPWVTRAAVLLSWLALATLLAVVGGIWARWLGLAAILPAAVNLIAVEASWATLDAVLLAGSVCWVAIFNSGRFSLWQPAEEYMFQRMGGS